MSEAWVQDLSAICAGQLQPRLTDLAAGLASVAGLGGTERQAVSDGLANTLRERILGRVIRVLLVELQAARITGRLTAAGSAARWAEWVDQARRPGFWESVSERYPTLLPRLRTSIDYGCASALALASRFAADRAALGRLAGGEPELTEVRFGAGDRHRGGQTVAVLGLSCGRVVYKPRSLALDAALGRLLLRLLPAEPPELRIRVPQVVERPDYGWAEYVAHRFCADDVELQAFYRGLGHWLAVTRLLSGNDLHGENVIAAGPVPVVVDCETFFTPTPAAPASGLGRAIDRATELVTGSVLRTGLLPGRAGALALRGADLSAAGGLPDEQPDLTVVTVQEPGTDRARIGFAQAPPDPAANRPSPQPRLGEFWPDLLTGFTELTAALRELDRQGGLAPLLAELRDCPVRVVLRETIAYVELGAMLWHPSSLHHEPAARERAARLLAGHGANAGVSTDPAVIAAEIDDLLVGDVPYFTATAGGGPVTGPGGTSLGDGQDRVAAALGHWRELDLRFEQELITCAVVSAYLDDGERAESVRLVPATVRVAGLSRRRRAAAARIMRVLSERAIRAPDDTVTWISPVLTLAGLVVQPLGLDMYSGLPGVAVLLAAYQQEVAAGRADPVPGTDELLYRALRTMAMMESQLAAYHEANPTARPEPPGGYVGLGARIWGWLLLDRLGVLSPGKGLGWATAVAGQLPAAVAADETHDVLTGLAGAVVPVLRLAEQTAEPHWRDLAVGIGDRLVALARPAEVGMRWPGGGSPDGLGGFAHGAAGIGWALARLAATTGQARFRRRAEAAFAFQDSLHDPITGGWRDLRKPDQTAANWCHGCDGVAVAAVDLGREDDDPRWADRLAQAATATWAGGLGATHTLCHGDLGSWEVLDLALAAGCAPTGLTRDALDARILSSLEEFGPRCAMTNDVFRPGLLSGMGGMAYQLLRMHPDCRLPSLLLPDPAAGNRP